MSLVTITFPGVVPQTFVVEMIAPLPLDDYEPSTKALALGDKCSASILLADSSRRLIVPNVNEWRGLNLLDMEL